MGMDLPSPQGHRRRSFLSAIPYNQVDGRRETDSVAETLGLWPDVGYFVILGLFDSNLRHRIIGSLRY